jgi:pimeloyl-ACP methyl ester carboxylesterase
LRLSGGGYLLTQKGLELKPVIIALTQWVDKWIGLVLSVSRARPMAGLSHCNFVEATRTLRSPLPTSSFGEAELRRLQVPTWIVWGMKDTDIRSPDADDLDALLPLSQGVGRVPEGKLFWPEEYPDILESELRQLWRR